MFKTIIHHSRIKCQLTFLINESTRESFLMRALASGIGKRGSDK